MAPISVITLCLATPLGTADFRGSTIAAVDPSGFQLSLIYKKYPTDEPVVPAVPWQLSFGAVLQSAASSIDVHISLDPGQPNSGIQILNGSASFVPEAGLYHNDDPGQRFEIVYNGATIPFVGAVHLLLEPEGLPAIPVRVDIGVTDRPGFPIAIPTPSTDVVAAAGDITGDGGLEIVFPGTFAQQGLYAFDRMGMPLAGWPFVVTGADVLEQGYSPATLADLDGDGAAEVVVVGWVRRDVGGQPVLPGTVTTWHLYVIEGNGALRWSADGDFRGVAAIADLDGDGLMDIVVGDGGTLSRFDRDGAPTPSWAAETANSILVSVPVLADIDGDPGNGTEIVACSFITTPPFGAQLNVWNQDGSSHAPAWPKPMANCVFPTLIDLDGNPTNGMEIVVGVDHFNSPPVDPETGFLNTFSVFAWHEDGSDASGWPYHHMRPPDVGFLDDRIIAPFAGGDVDGDGDPEIVVGTYGQGDPQNGNLLVLQHDGVLASEWPQWAGIAQTPSQWGGPALADLDGDGRLEIITGSFFGTYVFRGNGSPFPGFPKLTAEVFAQAAVADLDADGHLEIVGVSLGNRLNVWRMPEPTLDEVAWPQVRQGRTHLGAVAQSPDAIPAISAIGAVVMVVALAWGGACVARARHGALAAERTRRSNGARHRVT